MLFFTQTYPVHVFIRNNVQSNERTFPCLFSQLVRWSNGKLSNKAFILLYRGSKTVDFGSAGKTVTVYQDIVQFSEGRECNGLSSLFSPSNKKNI